MLLSVPNLKLGWMGAPLGYLSPDSPAGAPPGSACDVNGGRGSLAASPQIRLLQQFC